MEVENASRMAASEAPSDDPLAVCKEYLQYRGVTGTVIFAMMTGSQAYNLTTASSDKDYLGTYFFEVIVCDIPSDSIF